jgi:hypothetical protein
MFLVFFPLIAPLPDLNPLSFYLSIAPSAWAVY